MRCSGEGEWAVVNAAKTKRQTLLLTMACKEAIMSNYNEDIEISAVRSDKEIVKEVGRKKTENRFEFEVEITPPTREGNLRVFSDTLHITIKDKETIDIPCRGFYKAGR